MTTAYNQCRGSNLRYGEKDIEEDLEFNNSGHGLLRVLGFGGIPINIERAPAERFAHSSHDWVQPRLIAREMAILRLMNRLTDVTDWHNKVFDDITSLHLTLLVAPLISDAA
jgi:hypothetical protein